MTSNPISTLPSGSSVEARRSNIALQLGGALWIAHYLLQLLMGFSFGEAKYTGFLGSLDGFCFLGAIFSYCLGFGILARALWSNSWLAKAAMLFVDLAAIGVLGSVFLIAVGRPPALFGALGVISTCLSAIFVALAARRAQLWTTQRSLLLLLTGSLTFPLILLFIIPGQFIPGFLTDELPFALSGAAFIAFARMTANDGLG